MSKLLPLEYCKLDRAAKLLGCEVEDILHWGKIGAINICVKGIGSGRLVWSANGPQSQEELAASVRRIYSFGHFIDSELHQSPYSYFCYPIMENDLNPDDIKHMDDSRAVDALVFFGGFWAVDLDFPDGFSSYKEAEGIAGGYFRIKSTTPDKKGFVYSAEVQVPNSCHNIPTNDDFYIIKPDLDKLYNAIHNEGKLDNIYNNAELAEKASEQKQRLNAKPHHRSESTAIHREQVLAAAVNVREKYPDECHGFSRWAQAVFNHSHLYWPELDEPPLTVEKMERIIASAVNHGKPDKKN